MIIDEQYVKNLIVPRRSSSHKGENGTIGIVGGSRLYHGAPVLSAMGALRSGSDLAYLFVPEIIATPIRSMSPDLIIYPLPDSKITIGVANKILNFRNNITTFVIGPGMVNQKMNGLIKLVLGLENKNINIILDAGAINQELIDSVEGKNIVVTAHLGEFKKLINKELNNENEIKNELLNYAKNRNLVIVVKGETDYITNGNELFINKSGNSCMTKGGTGDILAGVIAAQLSVGQSPLNAAIMGTYFMGKTGELVYEKWGFQFMNAELLIELSNYLKKFNSIK
jgi:NAD(P)H-hydrate epimerase